MKITNDIEPEAIIQCSGEACARIVAQRAEIREEVHAKTDQVLGKIQKKYSKKMRKKIGLQVYVNSQE